MPCFQRRDNCGWPVDRCGKRYGRFEVILEASLSLFDAPEGAFGGVETGLPNQMRWDDLDYADDLAKSLGGRVTLRYALAPQSILELRGAYYGNPKDSARVAGVYAFFPGPNGQGGLSDPNSALLTTEAQMCSGELNWWKETCCTCKFRWDLGLGIRYLHFNEKATARDWVPPFPGLVSPDYVESDVVNRFIGGQIGIGGHYDVSSCFELNLLVKGLLGSMTREIDIRDSSFFAPGAHASSSEDTEFMGGGEVEISARFRVASWLGLTLGYNLLYLPGVVRAPHAMDFTQSTTGAVQAAQRTDDLTVHTFFAGLAFNF